MIKISSSIKNEPYKIEIISQTGNKVIADEPIDKGGRNLGFSPKELLASALTACTSATVKIYANRKEWDLQVVKINIELDYLSDENKTIIKRQLEFIGNLDESQVKRVLAVANVCQVHKILSTPIAINTQLVH